MSRSTAGYILFVATMMAVVIAGNRLGSAHEQTATLSENLTQLGKAEYVSPSLTSSISAGTVPAGDPPGSAAMNTAVPDGTIAPLRSAGTFSIFHKIDDAPPPEISAKAVLIADIKSGEVYFSVSPDMRWPTASITKLLTAYEAMAIDPNQEITIAPDDVIDPEAESSSFLKAGDTYRAGDLIKIMLLISSNEAAEALARTYGRQNFIAELNTTAREWGMSSSNFSDPSGLSAANQSTASDLLILAERIYSTHPEIFRTTRNAKLAIADAITHRTQTFNNINLLVKRPDFLGGKTGFTDEAEGNLLTLFSYGNRPVYAVVLGTQDRFGDMEKLITWFKEHFVPGK